MEDRSDDPSHLKLLVIASLIVIVTLSVPTFSSVILIFLSLLDAEGCVGLKG